MKKIHLLALLAIVCYQALAQQTSTDSPTGPVNFSAEQDRQHMLDQLGIKKMRPGYSGSESGPNPANYDETKANPFPTLPDPLILKNGKRVTTADVWWKQRRPEIAEDFEREVYGRIPKNVPGVTWHLSFSEREFVGRTPVVARQLIGHVDNSGYPRIDVNISMTLVTPADAKGPVPVLMMFGPGVVPAPVQPNRQDFEKINAALRKLLSEDPEIEALLDKYPAYSPLVRPPGISPSGFPLPPGATTGEVPSTHQLIAAGWGYALVDPSSIQADNGAGLTRGIIGLVNKGQPRKPDDWGALRAWAWGASRALDYLEEDSTVDARRVGIEGVSRYGKAALVALAFESRFAFGLIGSSGKGGSTLHRRKFGEGVENLTGGFYYWMAGNYLKYGAAEGKHGEMYADALPVDAHELIAMCAPRPVFISYGVPEQGDAKWLDHQGSYMAALAAGPVYTLLGAKDLSASPEFPGGNMPAVNIGLLAGAIAWRQHDSGHTDTPNIKYFVEWADRQMASLQIRK